MYYSYIQGFAIIQWGGLQSPPLSQSAIMHYVGAKPQNFFVKNQLFLCSVFIKIPFDLGGGLKIFPGGFELFLGGWSWHLGD